MHDGIQVETEMPTKKVQKHLKNNEKLISKAVMYGISNFPNWLIYAIIQT